jgi:hypothetical protein
MPPTMATDITALDHDTMTLEELCRRIDISLTVGYEQARKNALPIPAFKAGRQWRFSRLAYDRLMSGQHGDQEEFGLHEVGHA